MSKTSMADGARAKFTRAWQELESRPYDNAVSRRSWRQMAIEAATCVNYASNADNKQKWVPVAMYCLDQALVLDPRDLAVSRLRTNLLGTQNGTSQDIQMQDDWSHLLSQDNIRLSDAAMELLDGIAAEVEPGFRVNENNSVYFYNMNAAVQFLDTLKTTKIGTDAWHTIKAYRMREIALKMVQGKQKKIDQYAQANDLQAPSAVDLIVQGMDYANSDLVKPARGCFEKAVKKLPGNVKTWQYLHNYYRRQNRRGMMASVYGHALQALPEEKVPFIGVPLRRTRPMKLAEFKQTIPA